MPAGIDTQYSSRLSDRQTVLSGLERQNLLLSRARLAIVGLTIVTFAVWRTSLGWWYLVPVALFVAIAVHHARLVGRRDRARHSVAFYERGLARLRGTWPGHGTGGEAYRTPDHPYADDLDIFGSGGLFELLATTRTRAGESTLAKWLLAATDQEAVPLRQDAVRELAPLVDLREEIAVMGDGQGAEIHADALRAWATAPRKLPGGWPRVAFAALAIPAVGLPLYWLIVDSVSRGTARAFVAVLAIEGLLALWFGSRVRASIHHADASARDLELTSGLLRTIEQQTFSSTLLRRIQADLGGTERPASSEVARLGQLIALLESRSNMMFAVIAGLIAWATQLAFAIEAWRSRAGQHVPRWLEAVGEFEALAALAAFSAEHPDYAFPEIDAEPAHVEAVGLAHPLLGDSAVSNDIALGGAAPHLLVVSGSNMSGKSTLMRALGVNVALALAGAPTRTTSMRLSLLHVGASIRVMDSLQDGKSRFYAEITRLKGIVDLARSTDGDVLFLLDEILAGTNSHDRRQGADGVLTGLVDLGAIGLASTHDLALGEIATRLAPAAANVHFEDVFENDVLTFDYRLRPGIVRTSNAIALMRSVGLDV